MVAHGGQLTSLPIEQPGPSGERFQLARKQSTFVLAMDEPTTIRYVAKDAVKYALALWTRRPDANFFDEPQLKADSTDGSFTIELDASQLVSDAVKAVKSARFPDAEDESASLLERYLGAVSPAFESLVGRAPEGIPVPVYVVIVGQSSYGEIDYLVHCYLVDVPRASVEGNRTLEGPARDRLARGAGQIGTSQKCQASQIAGHTLQTGPSGEEQRWSIRCVSDEPERRPAG